MKKKYFSAKAKLQFKYSTKNINSKIYFFTFFFLIYNTLSLRYGTKRNCIMYFFPLFCFQEQNFFPLCADILMTLKKYPVVVQQILEISVFLPSFLKVVGVKKYTLSTFSVLFAVEISSIFFLYTVCKCLSRQ